MKIPSQILTAFRTCLLVSISAIAMTACSASSRTNAAKVSKAVENCDDQVWSELHSDVNFNSPGYSDRVKAIDSCGKAAIEGSALLHSGVTLSRVRGPQSGELRLAGDKSAGRSL